jgi:hypothetical protein
VNSLVTAALSGFNVNENAQKPPFADGLVTAFSWFMWLIALAATAGVIVQGAKLIYAYKQGTVGISEHGQGLAISVVGLTVIAAATAIVGALI